MGVPFFTNAGLQTAVLYATISASSSGHNAVIAAVAGKQILVLSYVLVASAAVTGTWQDFDGASTYTNLSGAMALGSSGGAGASASEYGHFATTAGHALQLNLGGAIGVGGHLAYTLI